MKRKSHIPFPHYRYDDRFVQIPILLPVKITDGADYHLTTSDGHYHTSFTMRQSGPLECVIFESTGIKDTVLNVTIKNLSSGISTQRSFDVNALHTLYISYRSMWTLLGALEEHYPEIKY